VLAATGRLGDSPRRLHLARYQPNGALDAAFGNGGFATLGFTPHPSISSLDSRPRVLVLPDGRIVVSAPALPADGTRQDSDIGLQRFRTCRDRLSFPASEYVYNKRSDGVRPGRRAWWPDRPGRLVP
jgi:hypothetical protein